MLQFEESKDFEANGMMYRVGIDSNGWISIQPFSEYEIEGEIYEEAEGQVIAFPPNINDEIGEYIAQL